MAEFRLETGRLVLREWHEGDVDDMHRLCSDPKVMATIGPVFDRERSLQLIHRLQERQARDGCTFWAIERKDDGRVIGFCGIGRGTVPFIADKLEIGWRLCSDCWGQSLAREAAEASLEWADEVHPGEDIWAITSVGNTRSRGLMERLGMCYVEGMDFPHPMVADDSPLKLHVTYRLERAA